MMMFTYLGDLRASLFIETQNVSALSEPDFIATVTCIAL